VDGPFDGPIGAENETTNKNALGDDAEPVVQARCSNDESASEAVIRALAAPEGVEPAEPTFLREASDGVTPHRSRRARTSRLKVTLTGI
jgi:hypothetical protein